MKVDKAPCWHCRRMFEPWTNEKFCSDKCTAAYDPDRAAERLRDAMIDGLVEEAFREAGET